MRKCLCAITLLILLLPLSAPAELVNTDYLEAIGNFEKSNLVRWYSYYSKSDYDFAANSLYMDPEGGSGYNLPTENDMVADGWNRSTGQLVNPGRNIVYRIVSGGLNNTNCQYFAVKNMSSGIGEIMLNLPLTVDSSKAWMLHTGDTVTFKIDQIKMSDYSGLPGRAEIHYYIRLSGISQAKELTPSSVPFSDQITSVIPSGVDKVILTVRIVTVGNIGTKSPGIYVDGAHLYIKRAAESDYDKRNIPAEINRSIKTQNVLFHESWTDIYAAARDYDVLTTHESEYASIPVLRTIHPNMKVLLYKSGTMCMDRRDSNGKDRLSSEGGLTFLEAKTNHPDWLYTGGSGSNGYMTDSTYKERYLLRISNKDYQQLWADKVIADARRVGADGIWMDDMSALKKDTNGINRDPWEVQQFLHYVCPKLKAAGLTVVENAACIHLDGSSDWAGNNGRVYFYPSWVPDKTYPASAGYSANSPDTVADAFFNEYSFFIPRASENHYDKAYWLACLGDMDEIARWNSEVYTNGTPKLSDKQKRQLCMWVLGRDFKGDSPYGLDGWINFGLTSYLLAQNDWTSLGFRVETASVGVSDVPYPDVNFSITKQLGAPDGQHFANQGDAYCRWRRYKATDDGGMGGVVIVNGNESVSRKYTLDIDAEDESGNYYTSGTKITLKPHTGRIFIQRQLMNVKLTVPTENVSPGQTIDVTVEYTNKGTTTLKNVIVRAQVPDQLQYVVGSAEKTGGRYYSDTKTVVWTISSVIPGGKGSRTFKAKVK